MSAARPRFLNKSQRSGIWKFSSCMSGDGFFNKSKLEEGTAESDCGRSLANPPTVINAKSTKKKLVVRIMHTSRCRNYSAEAVSLSVQFSTAAKCALADIGGMAGRRAAGSPESACGCITTQYASNVMINHGCRIGSKPKCPDRVVFRRQILGNKRHRHSSLAKIKKKPLDFLLHCCFGPIIPAAVAITVGP